MDRDVHSLMLTSSISSTNHGVAHPPRCPEEWFLRGHGGMLHARTMQVSISWQLPEEVPVDPQGSWSCSTPSHWTMYSMNEKIQRSYVEWSMVTGAVILHHTFYIKIISKQCSWRELPLRELRQHVGTTPDLRSKSCEFESQQKWQENFLLWSFFCLLTLIWCLLHPHVTEVACKRPRSFCQKCRWQVTLKHAYNLDPMKSEWVDYAPVQA